MPARLLHAAGVRLALQRSGRGEVRLTLEGRNLGDRRVGYLPLSPPQNGLTQAPVALADYFGYPLPGRSFYATLDWRF